MTDNTELVDVAASWLRGLAARGVRVTLHRNRIRLHPASAYRALTDAEILTLRHHRAAIKELVRAGIPLDVVRTTPTAEKATPEPAPPCPYCYASPCVGQDHPAFFDLHPVEAQQRADQRLSAEMRSRVRKPHPWDYSL